MNHTKLKEWASQLPEGFLGLNKKQIAYAIHRLEGLSGAEAARKASYSEKNAAVQAHKLEHNQAIKYFYEEARQTLEKQTSGIMNVDDVLQEASRMARQSNSTKEKKAGLEILASYHALMSESVAT